MKKVFKINYGEMGIFEFEYGELIPREYGISINEFQAFPVELDNHGNDDLETYTIIVKERVIKSKLWREIHDTKPTE